MQRELLIGDVFANAATGGSRRVAVALGEPALTFAELDAAADRLARLLGQQGVGPGTRVAVWCDDRARGRPVVRRAGQARLALRPPERPGRRDEVATLVGAEPSPISSSSTPGTAMPPPHASRRGRARGPARAVVLVPRRARRAAPVGTDPARGLLHQRQHRAAQRRRSCRTVSTSCAPSPGRFSSRAAPWSVPYPLFHMGAWTIALQQWQARDAVVLARRRPPTPSCAAVERHRGHPAQLHPRRVAAHPRPARRRAPALRRCPPSGSPTPAPRPRRSSCSSAIDGLPSRRPPPGLLRVDRGRSVASLDHADIDGQTRQLRCPRSRDARSGSPTTASSGCAAPLLFDGYLDDPTATAEAFVDGWYRTGDLADADDDGYLPSSAGSRDVIRTGGETVAPSRGRGRPLTTTRRSREVAVVGLPDADWGEVVCAVVVAAGGAAPPRSRTSRRHCAGALAPFKHPRPVEVLEAIPRTSATGQVQRRLLASAWYLLRRPRLHRRRSVAEQPF